MNCKKTLILATGLVLVLAAAACKRHDVNQPNPLGPSTLATVLKVAANPNVIAAGASRQGTLITATLRKFDGTPIVGRTLTFEICDAVGNKLGIGFFEGRRQVIQRLTDGAGAVSLMYYGPTAAEVGLDISVYIWASAGMEGDQFVSDAARINIIGNISELRLSLDANPATIEAGVAAESSVVTAALRKADGTPYVNGTVQFRVCDAAGTPVEIGAFEGGGVTKSRTTNTNGIARVTYVGPTSAEITAATSVYIWASVALQGVEDSVRIAITLPVVI